MKITVRMSDRHGFEQWAQQQGRVSVAGRVIGSIRDDHVQVKHIHVDPDMRRKHVGTRLYEAAAHFACERYGLPLASDTLRAPNAEEFWRKQLRKKRASCVGRDGDVFEPVSRQVVPGLYWRCGRYVLKCPAPATLARPPRRRT